MADSDQCIGNLIRVEPGNGSSHPAFGYVIVNPEENKMAVYHLWGE